VAYLQRELQLFEICNEQQPCSTYIWEVKVMKSLIALFLLPSLSWASTSEVLSFAGKAKNDQGKVVYIEKHKCFLENGKMTRIETQYFDPENKLIASLSSDFSQNPFVPTYHFRDYRFDHTTKVDIKEGKVRSKIKDKDSSEENSIKLTDSMIAGQGWHVFVTQNFERLLEKQSTTKIDLLIPGAGRHYPMKLSREKLDPENKMAHFLVEFDHWFLSLFAPNLKVVYSTDKKRLLRYKGPSNLKSKDGDSMNVTISFDYPESV
jgi:hypothetical protein